MDQRRGGQKPAGAPEGGHVQLLNVWCADFAKRVKVAASMSTACGCVFWGPALRHRLIEG